MMVFGEILVDIGVVCRTCTFLSNPVYAGSV